MKRVVLAAARVAAILASFSAVAKVWVGIGPRTSRQNTLASDTIHIGQAVRRTELAGRALYAYNLELVPAFTRCDGHSKR